MAKFNPTPGVVLINPKYGHNIGATLRNCSCFGIPTFFWTGSRCTFDEWDRIPREERMKGYKDVHFANLERPIDAFEDPMPVCVELTAGAMPLTYFEHPERAVYVFGPEDGHVPQVYRRLCHSIIYIPSFHCTNLSVAVGCVLSHRMVTRQLSGLEPVLPVGEMLKENRGYGVPDPNLLNSIGWDGK